MRTASPKAQMYLPLSEFLDRTEGNDLAYRSHWPAIKAGFTFNDPKFREIEANIAGLCI